MKRYSVLVVFYLTILHFLAVYGIYKYNYITPIPVQSAQIIAPSAPPTPSYNAFKLLLVELDRRLSSGGIIFLGDSITQRLSVNLVSPDAVNFGIGGDTSKGLSERIADYRSLGKAKAIVIQIGTNDALDNIPDFDNNLAKLAQHIPVSPALYWYAVPPIDSKAAKKDVNGIITKLNFKIKKICASHSNCTFIDLTNQYADTNGNLRAEFHVGDGIHLSPSGYQVWIESLKFNLKV